MFIPSIYFVELLKGCMLKSFFDGLFLSEMWFTVFLLLFGPECNKSISKLTRYSDKYIRFLNYYIIIELGLFF